MLEILLRQSNLANDGDGDRIMVNRKEINQIQYLSDRTAAVMCICRKKVIWYLSSPILNLHNKKT